MQYQHPEWDKTARSNAWKRRAETAVLAILVIAGVIAVVGWLRPGFQLFPGSSASTLTPSETEIPHPPSPEGAARAFLDGWQSKDYSKMYSLLSTPARDALSEEEFTAFYKNVGLQTTLRSLDYAITSVEVTPTDATVQFEVTLRTVILGDITEPTRMLLKYQQDAWKVVWDGQTVLPDLENGNKLVLHREAPARGNIYDREGLPLAVEAEVVEVGVIPGEITDEDAVLARLSAALRVPRELIRLKIAESMPDEYLPVGETGAEDIPGGYESLAALGGVYVNTSTRRYYYGGGVGSTVVGYTSKISTELLADYLARGYSGNETVGMSGLEKSAEADLAGGQGGTLMLTGPDDTPLKILAKAEPKPAMDVYTTLDRDLQAQIERTVLGPYNGAVVVLNRNTGEVLAMVSSKRYDNNLFTPGSFNGGYLVQGILNDPDGPLNNRAATGSYPLGSVFKIITMAAGLESGLFTPESVYDDATGIYVGGDGVERTDWTVEKEMKPHGKITFEQCLVQSCNPCFWNVGETLYNKDPMRVSDMAAAFGLGSATGIPGLDEFAGVVPGPGGTAWNVSHALDQAVGQGSLLVTPLQVADFTAAVGNGGTLYRPQILLSIRPPEGDPVLSFSPAVRGLLPLQPANLEVIQRAMRGVIYDPKGTARARFAGISGSVKIAGKTGTAQSGIEDPHSWFVAYTDNQGTSKPDIAVAVIAEYAGEGSTYAARMVRRVFEIYFFGRPSTLYPWESEYGIRATDTPEASEEPTPAPPPGNP
ncbi:MAG: penicillin-binding transpeptidase domain-containing protein [Anaerolineales bacterium]